MTVTQTDQRWLDYLERHEAAETEHSERHLLDHLIGTEQLLRRWQAPEHVCRAGLMHSVYGTESFDVETVSLDQRAEVRSLIGQRAERLAYLFCIIARQSLYDAARRGRTDLVDRTSRAAVPLGDGELVDLCQLAVTSGDVVPVGLGWVDPPMS